MGRSEEHDLLQAVYTAPDDDAPRLVYADWLEERGDPRAEFIRAQVERAMTPEWDPRHEELEAREQELLREHYEEWAGPRPDFRKG